jgi:hypothetical protein
MVVFLKSAPSVYKVVLTTSRRSQPYHVKRHNPSASSTSIGNLGPPQLVCDGASLTHSHTHSSSAHILKAVAVARGRRREVHA